MAIVARIVAAGRVAPPVTDPLLIALRVLITAAEAAVKHGWCEYGYAVYGHLTGGHLTGGYLT